MKRRIASRGPVRGVAERLGIGKQRTKDSGIECGVSFRRVRVTGRRDYAALIAAAVSSAAFAAPGQFHGSQRSGSRRTSLA